MQQLAEYHRTARFWLSDGANIAKNRSIYSILPVAVCGPSFSQGLHLSDAPLGPCTAYEQDQGDIPTAQSVTPEN